MARPALHTPEKILDGARTIVLAEGARAATIDAIARASKAPAGSLYHRFGSRDALLVELWIRAVRRSQVRFLEAIEARSDPREAIVAAGLSMIDFAIAEPEDARLLASLRHEDLVRSALPAPTARRLRELNRGVFRAVASLARELYGDERGGRERVTLAAFDLSYGALRRHLIAETSPPPGLRDQLERAIRAVLASPSTSEGLSPSGTRRRPIS